MFYSDVIIINVDPKGFFLFHDKRHYTNFGNLASVTYDFNYILLRIAAIVFVNATVITQEICIKKIMFPREHKIMAHTECNYIYEK